MALLPDEGGLRHRFSRHILPRMNTRVIAWRCCITAGWICLVGAGCAIRSGTTSHSSPAPADVRLSPGSDRTYQVHRVANGQIQLDGCASEPAWAQAAVERQFVFPWKQEPAPATEFRALWDATHLYFSFRVQDADIVVLDRLQDEQDAVFEDRVEVYLCRDERMKDYFCFEVDSRGRAFDYRASYYRQFDTKWNFEGLETRASSLPGGYEVEGRIPLSSFAALGFPAVRPGVRIRCGLYRAEFSHDRNGRKVQQHETRHNLGRKVEGPPPIEAWISWVDPKTKEPDFHVPASLGWLEFVK